MFQFSGLALYVHRVTALQTAGLPHSDISGSNLFGRSPELFAAVHVLHSLHKPRHPPYALAYFLTLWNSSLRKIPRRARAHPYSSLIRVNELFRAALAGGLYYADIADPGTVTVREGYRVKSKKSIAVGRNGVETGHSRKEVFQPHLPVRLPCYDLALVIGFALGRSLRSRTSGTPDFHGLTGGVYKARERIHRAMADARLLANPTSWRRVAASNPN